MSGPSGNKGDGDGDVAWPLGRQVVVQLLVTTDQRLAALHLREKEPLPDQLSHHCQHQW
jgi:hypothetical protein